MRVHLGTLIVLCAISAAAALGQTGQSSLPPPAAPLTALASPAPVGSAQPNLFADRSGRVWLSWIEPRAAGGRSVRLASLQGARWSEPVTIAEGANLLANWADFPSVFVARDGTLAAHWLETGLTRGAYGIRVATSRDGGRTWTPPAIPHRDNSPAEHGFVSFFDAPDGSPGMIWLDGRDMAGGHAAGAAGHGPAAMTLRATTIRHGTPGDETVVDRRVCDCCQTSAVAVPDGVVIAYRDRSDEEIRDISVARFTQGQWGPPVTVFADAWQIKSCPVNGPVLAASGDSVAVAWFTAVGGTSRVQVAFSSGGRPFSAPIRLDSNVTLGRLAMVMPGPDRVLVSSIERKAGPDLASELVIREARRNGSISAPLAVGMSADRSSGFARMALVGRRLIVAWTGVTPNAPPRVHVAATELR